LVLNDESNRGSVAADPASAAIVTALPLPAAPAPPFTPGLTDGAQPDDSRPDSDFGIVRSEQEHLRLRSQLERCAVAHHQRFEVPRQMLGCRQRHRLASCDPDLLRNRRGGLPCSSL